MRVIRRCAIGIPQPGSIIDSCSCNDEGEIELGKEIHWDGWSYQTRRLLSGVSVSEGVVRMRTSLTERCIAVASTMQLNEMLSHGICKQWTW